MKVITLSLIVLAASLTGCSTAFWYTQVQGAQYDKCENLPSAEDRRRCKAETYPDEDKYKREREAARGASK